MTDDTLTRVFGDALVAVCGADEGRLGHAVEVVAITPDDRAVWCIGSAEASLVDLGSLRVLARFPVKTPSRVIAAHAGSAEPSSVVVVGRDGTVSDLAGARLGFTVRSVGAAVFSRDGSTLAVLPSPGIIDRPVTVWRVRPVRLAQSFPGEGPIAIDATGAMVGHGVSNWKGLGLGFTRTADGVIVRRSLQEPMLALALSEDGATAFAARGDGVVRVPMDPAGRIVAAANVATKALFGTGHGYVALSEHRGGNSRSIERDDGARAEVRASPPFAVGVARSGRVAVIASSDSLSCVDFERGVVQDATTGHDDICDLAWSRDGASVASVATDGTVRVWDAQCGEERARIEGIAPGRNLSIAWLPDGRSVVVMEGDGVLSEWALDDGMWRSRVPSLGRAPRGRASVSVSPDGDHVAVLRGAVLRVFRRGGDTPLIERKGSAACAWREGCAATLCVLRSSPTASLDAGWEILDVRDPGSSVRGDFRAVGACLSRDGRHLWIRPLRELRAGALDVLSLDETGSPRARSLQTSRIDRLLWAAAGRLFCVRAELDAKTLVLDANDGLLTVLPYSLRGIARMSPSPDGARVAVVLEGRAAIVALPPQE